MATAFFVGSGTRPTFDAQGDEVYLTIAYSREAAQANRPTWSGNPQGDSPQFAASILNSASDLAVPPGREQVKRFCSTVPAATRFCQLAQKNIDSQDSLGH